MLPAASLPPASEPPGFTITATLDGHPVLEFDGRNIRMDRLLLADQRRLLAALAQAQHLVLMHQPGPSALVEHLDGVEALLSRRDPDGAPSALAPVAEAITTAHAALKPSAAIPVH